jgi:shikimate kinase
VATTSDNASKTRDFACPLYDEQVAVILVTGMSGTGKSTALSRLEQRGYRVVDTDFGGWIEDVPRPDGVGVEPQWREDRIGALIADHERSGEPLFIAGTVWNQGKFYPRFDEIVLLSAPMAVMLDRIANRDTNPFGKTAEDRERIVADTTEIEPLLRPSATIEIDTRKPLADVVDQLAALAGPPASHR